MSVLLVVHGSLQSRLSKDAGNLCEEKNKSGKNNKGGGGE